MITRGPASKSEIKRRRGVSQLPSRRQSILDTSERLFLEKGLEQTTMTDRDAERRQEIALFRYGVIAELAQ